jgi:hypothetical protein
VWDDSILDCISCAGTDGDSSEHFEYRAEDHGLAIADRAGGDTSSPCIGHIV